MEIKYYIYILYISSYIHILHKYRLFATSENVLNSQLEIKGQQPPPPKYIYKRCEIPWVRVRLLGLEFDLEREARVRYGSFLLLGFRKGGASGDDR